AAFVKPLYDLTDDVRFGEPDGDTDMVFLRADAVDDLRAALRPLIGSIKRDGAIWAVSPKGDPTIRDVDVIAAAKDAGLVDVKVVRWSATRTALKLVIPRAFR